MHNSLKNKEEGAFIFRKRGALGKALCRRLAKSEEGSMVDPAEEERKKIEFHEMELLT